ncbi:MAG: DUF4397 domain-containing protein [Acidobacteriia bacterium]|nr:DUF4397 domain-containing protein [Terriglobia bacterium]
MQGSADAGTVNVLVDGTTLFGNLTFAVPSNYAAVNAGSRHLQIESTNSTSPLVDETVSLNSGTKYTLISANFVSSIAPLLLVDDTTAPSSGQFQLRLVNDMPSVGGVDVYVVAPGTIPGSVPPTISNLGLDSTSAYLSMTAGLYEIIVTGAGNTFSYLAIGPVTFTAGQNRTIVLVSDLAGYGSVTLADLN